MIPSLALLTAVLAGSTSVLGHFTLDYPQTRGFDEDIESQFCGGFSTPASPRQPFPLSGASAIHFDSHHTLATIDILVSSKTNPTSFSDFETNLLKGFFQVKDGEGCVNVDFSTYQGLDLKNGSEVTIQVQYNGGDGNLFQCSDLVLIDNFEVPSNLTCTNDVSLSAEATASVSSIPVTSATASSTATGSHDHASSAVSSAVGSASAAVSSAAAAATGGTSAAMGRFENVMGAAGVMAVALVAGFVTLA